MLQEVLSRITHQKEINPDYIERRLFQLESLTGRVVDRFWWVDAVVKTEMEAESKLLKRYRKER